MMFEPRTFISTSGTVGVYRVSDNPNVVFHGWHRLAHVATGIPFPLVFEHYDNAYNAAVQLAKVIDWDAYVENPDQADFSHTLGLSMDMFYIAEDNRGALLAGKPLDHQKIAVMKKTQENAE